MLKRNILLENNLHTALTAAVEASKEIMNFYKSDFHTYDKSDGSPVTDADLASSNIILTHLAKTGIPVICEEIENVDYEQRKSWEYNWCVDPLDGTKEYIKRNDEFSVNIALIHKHRPVLGVIASPTEQKIIFSEVGKGVFICGFDEINDFGKWLKLDATPSINFPLRLIASRSHFGTESDQQLDFLSSKLKSFTFHQKGSALKFFDLAENKADIYVRFMPTMEWDIAAGQAILEELGGAILIYDSREVLQYNRRDLRNPSFIAYTESAKYLNPQL